MKILIYEHCTAVGSLTSNPSLSVLGWAMLQGCVEDCLSAGHEAYALMAPDCAARLPQSCRVFTANDPALALKEALIDADAALVIAPETDDILSQVTSIVEQSGKLLLGSPSQTASAAANKLTLATALAPFDCKVPHTTVWPGPVPPAGSHGMWVLKPQRGAGCQNIYRTTSPRDVALPAGDYLLQPFIEGVPASVSMIVGSHQTLVLSVNRQNLSFAPDLQYEGAMIPLQHTMNSKAIACARRVASAFPGLRGFVGVDMVLTHDDVFIIEVNPRITFAYCGLRRIVSRNLMAIIVAAASGEDIPLDLPLAGSVEIDRFGRVNEHAHTQR